MLGSRTGPASKPSTEDLSSEVSTLQERNASLISILKTKAVYIEELTLKLQAKETLLNEASLQLAEKQAAIAAEKQQNHKIHEKSKERHRLLKQAREHFLLQQNEHEDTKVELHKQKEQNTALQQGALANELEITRLKTELSHTQKTLAAEQSSLNQITTNKQDRLQEQKNTELSLRVALAKAQDQERRMKSQLEEAKKEKIEAFLEVAYLKHQLETTHAATAAAAAIRERQASWKKWSFRGLAAAILMTGTLVFAALGLIASLLNPVLLAALIIQGGVTTYCFYKAKQSREEGQRVIPNDQSSRLSTTAQLAGPLGGEQGLQIQEQPQTNPVTAVNLASSLVINRTAQVTTPFALRSLNRLP